MSCEYELRGYVTNVSYVDMSMSASTSVYKEGFRLRVVCFFFLSHATSCIIILRFCCSHFGAAVLCSLSPAWVVQRRPSSVLRPRHSHVQRSAAMSGSRLVRRLLVLSGTRLDRRLLILSGTRLVRHLLVPCDTWVPGYGSDCLLGT